MSFNRRFFLQTSLLLGAGGLGFFPKQRAHALDIVSNDLYSKGPIDLLNEYSGSTIWTGDHEMAAHEIFWDKNGFLKKQGGIPRPTQTYDMVVIGGGIAGLSTAYWHRNEKTLLLEGHPQMGGNSKAEKFEKLSHSLGAAYINVPEVNDPLDKFLKELGVSEAFREEDASDFTVNVNGKLIKDFWNQGEEFRRVREKFLHLYETDYPEIPVYPDGGNRDRLNALDRLTFSEWLKQEFADLDPVILEFFHQYCWSSFGGSPDELSAAQAVGFVASDFNGVQALPGGNAVIADAIYQKLKLSRVELRNNCFAVNVKNTGSGVEVTYFEDDKRLVTVKAKRVLIATPKLVAKFMVEDLPKSQADAMKDLRYRCYVVVNVLLNKKVPSIGYDVFALKGKVPESPRKEINDRGFCDIIFADWANHDSANQSALTLYVPQPYEGANQFLFSPYAYENHKERIMKNIGPWLTSMNLTQADIAGIRMTRMGHGMPLARQGQIVSGVAEAAHKSLDNAIAFAHSDNWVNPCFETAFYSARAAFA